MKTLGTLFTLVMELAKIAPAAIPILTKLVRAALGSPDPAKALGRAALAISAKQTTRAAVDQVLKRSKAIR